MANRIFIINIRKCEFIGEFDTLAAGKKAAKKTTGDFIVTKKDDLKQLTDKVKIKLIVAWCGGDVEKVKPVALEYRVMNLLNNWVGNTKLTLTEEKTMKKKTTTKKAPVRKTATKKKVVAKKTTRATAATKKKVTAKKAPAKKVAAAKEASARGKGSPAERLLKALTKKAQTMTALADKVGVAEKTVQISASRLRTGYADGTKHNVVYDRENKTLRMG